MSVQSSTVSAWATVPVLSKPGPVKTSFILQALLLDVEVKGKSIRSVLSFPTRGWNEAKLVRMSKLDRRWHKLWLGCAEWKCLLEVAIQQQEEEVSL